MRGFLFIKVFINVKELIRKILKEEVGVPSNIVNVANQLYNQVIDNLEDNEPIGDFDNVDTYIKGKFKIGDLKFKTIIYTFEFKTNDVDDEIGIAGMATGGGFKVTKKFKIKSKIDKDSFNIKFVIFAPSNATGKDIKEYLKKEKNECISSITHELKHRYDDYKKPKTSLIGRGEYIAFTTNRFGDIDPINRFIHNLYFVHTIENLVRPSEIAGAIDAGDITKKGFYNFLTNHRVFKKLKEIQGFTYEGFRQELIDYVDKIKVLFDVNDIEYDGLSDEQIVDKILDLLLLNLKQWKAQTVHRLLADSPLDMIFGFKGEKDKFFTGYLNRLSRFDGNIKKYFEYEQKMFNFVATKMIKKISKVYAMTKNDTTESIINWDLWHKAKGTNSEIVTEFSYLKESDGRLPKTHPMIKAIVKVIGEAGEFDDSYSMPYSDNDDMVDYHIEYHVDKVSLWAEGDGEFSGTIYLIIDRIILGDSDGDEWTRVYYRDDLPSWSWDRMEEDILSKIEKWIPNVGVDIELIFPGFKN
jgi:hypothetical protein